MQVDVYRNLRNGKLSVREKGIVVCHAEQVFMRDVKFVVGPKGRERVLREKQKNVHAFVRGELLGFSLGTLARYDDWDEWPVATYNPYAAPHFFPKELGPRSEVHRAARAVVDASKGVFFKL